MAFWERFLARQAPGSRPARQERIVGGRRVWLDLNPQVLRFEIDSGPDPETPIDPIPDLSGGFISAALLALKARRVEADLGAPLPPPPPDAPIPAPTRDSDWPTWLLWSLEPLERPDLGPEARRMRIGSDYRAELRALRRALLRVGGGALAQVEPSPDPVAPLDPPNAIRPLVRVEPLATHYLRRGLAYRFLAETRAEFSEMERLYLGAFATACEDLGLGGVPGLEAESGLFLDWAARADRDPDLRADTREMIPLGENRALLLLGWMNRRLDITFERPPDAAAAVASPLDLVRRRVEVNWMPACRTLPNPVAIEAGCGRILSPAELRALADRGRTAGGILRALA